MDSPQQLESPFVSINKLYRQHESLQISVLISYLSVVLDGEWIQCSSHLSTYYQNNKNKMIENTELSPAQLVDTRVWDVSENNTIDWCDRLVNLEHSEIDWVICDHNPDRIRITIGRRIYTLPSFVFLLVVIQISLKYRVGQKNRLNKIE